MNIYPWLMLFVQVFCNKYQYGAYVMLRNFKKGNSITAMPPQFDTSKGHYQLQQIILTFWKLAKYTGREHTYPGYCKFYNRAMDFFSSQHSFEYTLKLVCALPRVRATLLCSASSTSTRIEYKCFLKIIIADWPR